MGGYLGQDCELEAAVRGHAVPGYSVMQQKEFPGKKSNILSPFLYSASAPKATQCVWNRSFGLDDQLQATNRFFQMGCMEHFKNSSLHCLQRFDSKTAPCGVEIEIKPEKVGSEIVEFEQKDDILVGRMSTSSSFACEQELISLSCNELFKKKAHEPFHSDQCNLQVDFTSAGLSVENDKRLSVEDATAATTQLQTAYKLNLRKQSQISPSKQDSLADRSSSREERRTKRRKTQEKRIMHVPFSSGILGRSSAGGLSSDSWTWRKYGQKPIKGSPYPRGYYRCSSSKGCLARKQVERSQNDPSILIVTYTCDHNHPGPPQIRSSSRPTTATSTAPREQLLIINPAKEDSTLILSACQPTEINPFFSVISSDYEACLDESVLAAMEAMSTDSDQDLNGLSIFCSPEDEDFFAELDELPESSTGFKKPAMEDKLDVDVKLVNAGVVVDGPASANSCLLVTYPSGDQQHDHISQRFPCNFLLTEGLCSSHSDARITYGAKSMENVEAWHDLFIPAYILKS